MYCKCSQSLIVSRPEHSLKAHFPTLVIPARFIEVRFELVFESSWKTLAPILVTSGKSVAKLIEVTDSLYEAGAIKSVLSEPCVV